ncbi:hypothetical protein [uncultured Planococcus sp.]|uniref:hypothetical protein n=1 Tax=uncultured Planococcus sp. TaxID=337815 RepID=UPI002637C6C5|nr:hypothetical protein [uncultured Planococcus sp.]
MVIKKQTVVFSLLFNTEETYAESGADAISHCLFNEEGFIEWDYKVTHEESLSADIDDATLEQAQNFDGEATLNFLNDTGSILVDYDGENTVEGLRSLIDEVAGRIDAIRNNKIAEYEDGSKW